MKKILAMILAVGMLFSLAACGSSDSDEEDTEAEETEETEAEETEEAEEEEEASEETDSEETAETDSEEEAAEEESEEEEYQQVQMLDSGYSTYYNELGEYTMIYYAVELYNPNEDYAINFPEIHITVRNEDGTILSTDDQTLNSIAAGDSYYYGNEIYYEGTIPDAATIEISVSNGTDLFDYTEQEGSSVLYSGELAVSNTSSNTGSYDVNFTGEVTNNSSEDQTIVAIVVIFSLEGQIVGGAAGYVNDLAAGATSAFEVSVSDDYTGYDSYEIYAIQW